MFPHEDVMLEDGLADKPIFLSYRTQQLLLMAIQKMEVRYNWLEMDDVTWDELDDYIAQAETEILNEIAGLPMLTEFKEASKTNTQALTGGTEASVLFNSGDHEPNPQANRIKPLAGKVTITGFVHLTSGTATQITLAIRKNGTTDIARTAFANTATAQKMTITVPDDGDSDDYYELRVLTNQNATIQNSEPAYLKWIRWYESP
jgi:hypothetical protein